MQIKIKDETQTLTLSNEELDNDNFVDIELCDDEVKDNDNPRGLVSECTMSIDELKAGVDAFYNLREQRKEK